MTSRAVAAKSAPTAAKARRPRDSVKTKAHILDCALAEFATHGYDGARIERIVKAAGINISLAYQYFGSKENLFIAVMEQALNDAGVTYTIDRETDAQHGFAPAGPRHDPDASERHWARVFDLLDRKL